MTRRNLMRCAGATVAGVALSKTDRLRADDTRVAGWRRFEVKTRVEILKSSGATRVWLPAPLSSGTPYQRTLSNRFRTEGGTARIVERRADGLRVIAAEFPAGVKPVLTLTSRVATRNHTIDLSARHRGAESRNPAGLDYFRRATKLLPIDGIVKQTADEITRGVTTDIGRARAIYDWIIDRTFRDPKVRGCGRGDIRFMLESNDLRGKCADLNALYVGLARAAGLPARDVYGIRIAESKLGYKSLGVSPENITKAQHCRAEVYISGYGWVPVDPADVLKVVLEEPPGNRPLNDELVRKARAQLFGSWEMNWMAFNFGHDVALPGSTGAPLGFFMYPEAETANSRLDSLDPDSFRYQITSWESPHANG